MLLTNPRRRTPRPEAAGNVGLDNLPLVGIYQGGLVPRFKVVKGGNIFPQKGVQPKIVQERLGYGSIQITLDTYSHVAPGLQQAAANKFDEIISLSGTIV